MTAASLWKRCWRSALPLGVLAALAVSALTLLAPAADHRDGPILVDTQNQGRRDINDIYVFRSPTNAANTVFVFTNTPFPGVLTPTTFDNTQYYDIKIDNNLDFVEDITFRVTLSAPDAMGVQDVTLRGLPAGKFPPTGILARGKTGTNIPVAGGGLFRAANQDDPFFFDAEGFRRLVEGEPNALPRPVGPANNPNTAKNFFGPNVNTLAFTLEIASTRLTRAGGTDILGVWVRIEKDGAQIDFMGRPGINTALIPRVPRGPNNPPLATPRNRVERRNAFNAGIPSNHRRDFRDDMIAVFTNFYGQPAARSATVTDLLLPDVLLFQVGNPNGFGTFIGPGGSLLGNGRRLRDDVIDVELTVITNGAVTTDNVPDDNGAKITDGNMGTTPAFPYIGNPNDPPQGLNNPP